VHLMTGEGTTEGHREVDRSHFPQKSLPVPRAGDAPQLERFTTVTIGHGVARAGPVELALRRASSGPGDCQKEWTGRAKTHRREGLTQTIRSRCGDGVPITT
jgi:hypothetical protein